MGITFYSIDVCFCDKNGSLAVTSSPHTSLCDRPAFTREFDKLYSLALSVPHSSFLKGECEPMVATFWYEDNEGCEQHSFTVNFGNETIYDNN